MPPGRAEQIQPAHERRRARLREALKRQRRLTRPALISPPHEPRKARREPERALPPPTRAARDDPRAVADPLRGGPGTVGGDQRQLPRRAPVPLRPLVLLRRDVLGARTEVEGSAQQEMPDVVEAVPILDRGAELPRETVAAAVPMARLRPIGEDQAAQDDGR